MAGRIAIALVPLCAFVHCWGCMMAEPTHSLADRIPREVVGLRAEKDSVYDRSTLFDYIDGGAEPYLHYGFQRALVRRFVRPGQPAVTADVFDMGEARNAYGIFTFEREGDEAGIGQDSEFEGGFLRFWKGPLFVSVLAERDAPETRSAVLEIGRAVAGAITETGPRPEVVDRLPKPGLLPNRVRYFRDHLLLTYHYYIADANILHIGQQTEVALATYWTEKGNLRLLLVRYPTPQEAGAALDEFLKAYAPEATAGEGVQTEDGGWVMAERNEELLAIVFDAPSPEQARSLIQSTWATGGEGRP